MNAADIKTAAAAIEAFAEFIIADRKVTEPTLEQCEEIAKIALMNLGKIVAGYEKAVA